MHAHLRISPSPSGGVRDRVEGRICHVAFLSGLLYLVGESVSERRMVYRSPRFFPLQAIRIIFDFTYITKRLLLMGGIKFNPGQAGEPWAEAVVIVMGYCWVILWFCLTLPMHIDGTSVAGFYTTDRGAVPQLLLDTWKRLV